MTITVASRVHCSNSSNNGVRRTFIPDSPFAGFMPDISNAGPALSCAWYSALPVPGWTW